jgi:dihydroflavonol-4-reductase
MSASRSSVIGQWRCSLRGPSKVLVTGATGLLGQHLVRQLTQLGYSVRALARSPEQQCFFPSDVEVVIGDIRKLQDVDSAIAGCRFVFHACTTHVYNLHFSETHAVDVLGTQNVCDAASRHQCERLVFTSTIAALGGSRAFASPGGKLPARKQHALNKTLADELVSERARQGLPAIIINPAFFIGSLDYSPSPFRLWVPSAIVRPVALVPSGGFNVLGVADVARFHIWALENGEIGQRYAVIGDNISLQEYVSRINRLCGSNCTPRVISPSALRFIARGRVLDGYVASMLSRLNYVDTATLPRFYQYSLTGVLEDTVLWFKRSSALVHPLALVRYIWKRYV